MKIDEKIDLYLDEGSFDTGKALIMLKKMFRKAQKEGDLRFLYNELKEPGTKAWKLFNVLNVVAKNALLVFIDDLERDMNKNRKSLF